MSTNEPGSEPAYPSEWNFVIPSRLRPRVRCHAHKTNGAPCRKWAMHGQQVCDTHGGRAPQARLKARYRLFTAAAQLYAEQYVAKLNAERAAAEARRRSDLGLPPGKPLVTYRHARAYRAAVAEMQMEQAARRAERDELTRHAAMPWVYPEGAEGDQ